MYVLATCLLRTSAQVAYADTLAFTLWVFWAHTLPGVMLWRMVDWRRRAATQGRPYLEDIVLGTTLGVVIAIPLYLLATFIGVPRLIAAWPLLVLAPALLKVGPWAGVWRPKATPTPTWWSWSLAALMLYVVCISAYTVWSPSALTLESLRSPYVDEPYHLALVSEFRHHFPAQAPFVAGTPLRYHWMVYPFMAAGTWGSGVEAITLIRILAPAFLCLVAVLGSQSPVRA